MNSTEQSCYKVEVCRIQEFIHNPNTLQMFQESESSFSSVPDSQSIETYPAANDESNTKLVAQIDIVADNSGFSAAQEELYHFEECCDLFVDPLGWLRLYHPELCLQLQ